VTPTAPGTRPGRILFLTLSRKLVQPIDVAPPQRRKALALSVQAFNAKFFDMIKPRSFMRLEISVNVKNLVVPRKAAPVLDSGRPAYTLLSLFDGCEMSSMSTSDYYDWQFTNGTILANLGVEHQAPGPDG
jgi:hypothetical protein